MSRRRGRAVAIGDIEHIGPGDLGEEAGIARRLRLGAKARELFGGDRRGIGQHLQRHDPAERELTCLDDDAHAAATQDLDQFVAGRGMLRQRDRRRAPLAGSGRLFVKLRSFDGASH